MSKDLSLFKNFWNDVPSLFDWNNKNLFGGFSHEFEKIMNGKCDFEELEDRYTVELEVPGVEKEEINLGLKEDILTIAWNRKRENKNEKAKNTRYERSEGSFTRSFHVEGADAGKIEAELKNGVLKISVPKLEGVKSRKIEIK